MNLVRLVTLSFFCLLIQKVAAQDLVSSYKSKNKTEKTILAKLKALPEIKQHYAYRKKPKPDVIISSPDSHSECYRFQVGFDFPDRFSTNYYLSINPKTFQVWYEDFLDESGDKSITLVQWRQWRSNQGFNKLHKWVNGKLVVLEKPKAYAQKKGSHS